MHLDFIEEMLIEYRKDFYLYPVDRLEQRIYEEKLRADMTESSFVYFELPLSKLVREEKFSSDGYKVWQFFLKFLAAEVRGSDIKGIDQKRGHLCFLLLDTKLNALQQFLDRLYAKAHKQKLSEAICSREDLPIESFMYTGKKS